MAVILIRRRVQLSPLDILLRHDRQYMFHASPGADSVPNAECQSYPGQAVTLGNNTIGYTTVSTFDACCSYCSSVPGCQSFHFKADSSYAETSYCNAKSVPATAANRQAEAGYVSGSYCSSCSETPSASYKKKTGIRI